MVIMIANIGAYEFISLGETEKEALKALKQRWKKQCTGNPKANANLIQELHDGGEVQVAHVEPGNAIIYGVE